MQDIIHEKIRTTAINIAESSGAEATVEITKNVPVTYNNLDLTKQMLPTLYSVAGESNIRIVPATTGAEDFSVYANKGKASMMQHRIIHQISLLMKVV